MENILIKNARIIVGNGDLIDSADVLIQNGQIKDISRKSIYLDDARIIEAGNFTLMPGIIDTHTHLFPYLKVGKEEYEKYLEKDILKNMKKKYLEYGVTTIKSLCDPLELSVKLRDILSGNKALGPRLSIVGPMFSVPDGHPAATMTAENQWLRSELCIETSDKEHARFAVRKLAERKIDAIKLFYQEVEGLEIKPKLLPYDVVLSIIDEAHRHNIRVTAHTWAYDDAVRILETGIDGIEHGVLEKKITDGRVIKLLKDKNAFYIPTLFIGHNLPHPADNPDRNQIANYNLKKVSNEGVQIALGTDSHYILSTPPGRASIEEMEFMAKAGLSPKEIIKAATYNAAKHLGILNETGTIEKGKAADLILINGDPLRNISAVKNIHTVLRGGKIVHNIDADEVSNSAIPVKSEKSRSVSALSPIGWFLIPVLDIRRAKTFYEKLLNIELSPIMGIGSTFPSDEKGIEGSGVLLQLPDNKPQKGGISISFSVSDIDETISKVENIGGKIIQQKQFLLSYGQACVIEDTEGNNIGLFTPIINERAENKTN